MILFNNFYEFEFEIPFLHIIIDATCHLWRVGRELFRSTTIIVTMTRHGSNLNHIITNFVLALRSSLRIILFHRMRWLLCFEISMRDIWFLAHHRDVHNSARDEYIYAYIEGSLDNPCDPDIDRVSINNHHNSLEDLLVLFLYLFFSLKKILIMHAIHLHIISWTEVESYWIIDL